MVSERPTHLVAWLGATLTMCELPLKSKSALPVLYLPFVPAHRAGHARRGVPFTLCPRCEAEMVQRQQVPASSEEWPW